METHHEFENGKHVFNIVKLISIDLLTSTGSSVSSCSDFSVDANSSGRVMQKVSSDSNQEEPSLGRIGHFPNQSLQSLGEIDMSTDIYNKGYSFRNVATEKREARDDNVDSDAVGFNEEPEMTHPLENGLTIIETHSYHPLHLVYQMRKLLDISCKLKS